MRISDWSSDVCSSDLALNAVFCGAFMELAPTWNFQTSMLWSEPDGLGLSYGAFRRLLADPGIVHYTSPSKPWHFSHTHPYKSAYYHYLHKKIGRASCRERVCQ